MALTAASTLRWALGSPLNVLQKSLKLEMLLRIDALIPTTHKRCNTEIASVTKHFP